MSGNPLLGLFGPLYWRVNGGALNPLRGTLRMHGAVVTDVEADERSDVDQSAAAAPTLTTTLEAPGDFWTHTAGWFGVSADFIAAGVIYVAPTDVDARIAGFAVPSGPTAVYRKLLINSSPDYTLELFNFRHDGTGEELGSDGLDPGMLQCRQRRLAPGQSARLVWDPVSHLWLVNAGQYSGDIITHEDAIVTDDSGDTITEGV